MLEQGGAWDNYLSLIEFTYNKTLHSSIETKPYEVMYGRTCRTSMYWYESDENVILGSEIVQ